MSRRHFTHKKRKTAAEPEWDEGIELQDLRQRMSEMEERETALGTAINTAGVPNMMVKGERRRLAIALFEGNYQATVTLLREQNAELVAVLESQLINTSPTTEQSLLKQQHHIDGVLLDLCRAQNIHKVPVLAAAISLLAECNHVAREYHDISALFHRGTTMSEKWVRDFLVEAREWRPEPTIIMIEGVAVVVFDNLSMKVDYSSYSSEGVTGYSLHMTNWLSMRVPRFLAPTMNARKLCAHAAIRTRAHCLLLPLLSLRVCSLRVQFAMASSAPTCLCGASRACSSWTTWRSGATRSGAGSCFCAPRAMPRCWTGHECGRCGDRTKSTTRRCLTCCSHHTQTWPMSSTSCGTHLLMSRCCLWLGMALR
mgnify:CR=1 FL=1